MNFAEKMREGFFKNPLALLLLLAFAIAEHANYQRSKELNRVCELTGPHDDWVAVPRNDREEIDKICISRAAGGL
jgi:hypothetical protein